MKGDVLRKIRHDFKMGVEELLAAISLHGNNDNSRVDPDDSQEVFNTIKKMESLWNQLEDVKGVENEF